ncbi:MAG: D-glucuronyl C5-epimerase family protein [Solirubrobacteraceae bacterium]
MRGKAIDGASFTRAKQAFKQAQGTLSHLTETRHTELADVLANVDAIASAKELTASRLPLLTLTIERNREWWANDSLLSYGARVSFPGSRLVWEYYTGQGIEVQWLGTFGEANGYYLAGDEDEALKQVLDEARELASERAGGIAWEYMFQFDGGKPPWTSSLSQGTAIQAYARAASRLKEPAFQKTAEEALGIFQTPPPAGVRVQREVGGAAAAEYVEYSFAPTDRILNGYIQSLNGLYDFTKLTGSQAGQRLFEEGDAEARAQVPSYNTGAWSMYDQHTESDLGYHELLAEFLSDLCGRTREGEPLAPPAATSTSGSQGGTGTGTTSAAGGGKPAQAQIAGDGVYCTTAEEFEADIHTPPVLKLLSRKLPDSSRAGVMFSLSKIATISLTVRGKSGKVVATNSATVEGGRPRLLWVTPKGTGSYTISATATSLAGDTASTSGEVTLTKGR